MHHFWADMHWDSENLCSKMGRPFSSIEAWVDFSIGKINDKAVMGDTIWFLGDLSYRDPQQYRRRILCKDQRLIVGNHDSPATIRSFGHLAWQARTIRVEEVSIYLNHYPTIYWDKSHNGSYHLYGHTHSQREDTLDSMFPARRSMDVSPENHFRLFGTWDIFSFSEIHEYLKDRAGHDEVSFYKDYQARVFSKFPRM